MERKSSESKGFDRSLKSAPDHQELRKRERAHHIRFFFLPFLRSWLCYVIWTVAGEICKWGMEGGGGMEEGARAREEHDAILLILIQTWSSMTNQIKLLTSGFKFFQHHMARSLVSFVLRRRFEIFLEHFLSSHFWVLTLVTDNYLILWVRA